MKNQKVIKFNSGFKVKVFEYKTIRELARRLMKLEGKKSSVLMGDMLEVLRLLAIELYKDPNIGFDLKAYGDHLIGETASKREKKVIKQIIKKAKKRKAKKAKKTKKAKRKR